MRKDNGDAIVEFALLAPILFLLLLGLVDFGRVFDAWLVTTNAAREGARYAAIYASQDYLDAGEVQQLTRDKVADYLDSGFGTRSDVAYSASNITVNMPAKASGQPVTVNVAVQVQIWALLNVFLSNPADIHGQATMRI